MSQTDLGEFFLGKMAGCADKTTILNAVKGQIVMVSSIPERFVKSLSLPDSIVVIMANSNIPRLNSPSGRHFLSKSYSNETVDSISNWANSVMRRFGSFVFMHSVESLTQSLRDENACKTVGLTKREVDLVLNALKVEEETNGCQSLIRELCFGGKLASSLLENRPCTAFRKSKDATLTFL
jgi:hypothetical protein